MSEDTTKAEDGLTRREMLKKSALVGAVAWTIPIVGSFNAPAFGTHGGVVSPGACTDWTCGQAQDICGNTPSAPPAIQDCLCDLDIEGNTFCWNNEFCSNSPACNSSADCAGLGVGWRCSTSCCGQTCLPPCGTFSTTVSSGATASGA